MIRFRPSFVPGTALVRVSFISLKPFTCLCTQSATTRTARALPRSKGTTTSANLRLDSGPKKSHLTSTVADSAMEVTVRSSIPVVVLGSGDTEVSDPEQDVIARRIPPSHTIQNYVKNDSVSRATTPCAVPIWDLTRMGCW